MDRRIALAIGLMLIVAIIPSLLLSPREPPATDQPTLADTLAEQPAVDIAQLPLQPHPALEPPVGAAPDTTPSDEVLEGFVTVESPLYRYVFSTRGVRLVSATLKSYRTFAPNDSGLAQLIPEPSHFLGYSVVLGRDTVPLSDWNFSPSSDRVEFDSGDARLDWVARRGSVELRIRQTFRPDRYLFDIDGDFSSAVGDAALILVSLGPRHRLIEADSVWDYRSYAVVTKARSTDRTGFGKLDAAPTAFTGPFEWVAIKSRYFVSAILTIEEGLPQIGGAVAWAGPKTGKYATHAEVLISLPAPGGRFSHSVYVGPQEFRRLAAVGHGLEDVNPYGWILRPIIRPVANLIVRVLLWAHETLRLGYGWVLILVGIAVRVLLWPLNQKAMRSSMSMQALQPQIKAVQERHKSEPQRQQQEMMKLYKEHKVNPLGGCLPMLLPMPMLFALFFVFRETIEFRGVPFLWLPDLSRADPLYILPVVLGLSMYGVSKLGQLGIPPNPQQKMFVYFMPVMLTVLFLKFASGLNLYYAVSNIASIPQQWLIAKERLKRPKNTTPRAPPAPAPQPKKQKKRSRHSR